MSFTFSAAKRANSHLLIALAGASGTGKTYSGMELAKGICGDEPFAVIDTEAGRALHYTDTFKFHHCDFAPPFTPERYLQAVQAAEKQGFKAIVIDSMSHEYDGEGGIMQAADESGAKGPAAWLKPKMRHKAMMNGFLQVRSNLIFCLRAEERIDMSERDDRGKVIVKNAGWQPVCEKRFMYEMIASFTFAPAAPGVVDLSLPHKVQDQHRMAFLPGRHVTAEAGAMLDRWARGETIETPHKDLWDKARRIAHEGTEGFRRYWTNVATTDDKANLRPIILELKGLAASADTNLGDV